MEYIAMAAAAAQLLTALMPTIVALIDEITKAVASGQTPPPAKVAALASMNSAVSAVADVQKHLADAFAAK